VEKADIHKIGQIHDMESRLSRAQSYVADVVQTARRFIYELGLNVAGAAVERILCAQSWVPTLVCFGPAY
jgi:hypothetical protein